jgi:hypothetical protein
LILNRADFSLISEFVKEDAGSGYMIIRCHLPLKGRSGRFQGTSGYKPGFLQYPEMIFNYSGLIIKI